MELYEQAAVVHDRRTLLEFVKALIADREEVAKGAVSPSLPYGRGANGWENGSIEAFLEAESTNFGVTQGCRLPTRGVNSRLFSFAGRFTNNKAVVAARRRRCVR